MHDQTPSFLVGYTQQMILSQKIVTKNLGLTILYPLFLGMIGKSDDENVESHCHKFFLFTQSQYFFHCSIKNGSVDHSVCPYSQTKRSSPYLCTFSRSSLSMSIATSSSLFRFNSPHNFSMLFIKNTSRTPLLEE